MCQVTLEFSGLLSSALRTWTVRVLLLKPVGFVGDTSGVQLQSRNYIELFEKKKRFIYLF